ncbi:MAG: AAA family ATPase [Candidatus Geothermarchaeales archaeon]
MNPSRLLICTSGLPGSGKGVVLQAAKRLGLPTFVIGDSVRTETAKQGLEPTPANTAKIMLQYREKYGPHVFAELTAQNVDELEATFVLVDGVRSMDELDYFRRCDWGVVTLAVLSSPDIRFERLSRRGRVDDVRGREEFLERERREISVGIDEVILHAEHYLVNENQSEEEVLAEAEATLREILRGRAGVA